MIRQIFRILCFCCLWLSLFGCSPEKPEPGDFIRDQAELLSQPQRERLQEFQVLLLREQNVQLLVITLNHPAEDINQTALDLFEQAAIGTKTGSARGLLLVIDPQRRQARIEVGYDLEGIFPDGFIAGLEYDQMRPFFRQNRIGAGIEALTELLVARLLGEHEAMARRTDGPEAHLSGGGGARIALDGKASPAPKTTLSDPEEFLPQTTPLATLERYRQVLTRRIKNPDLEIYTPGSREFFHAWLVTDAQQQNALRELEAVLSQAEVKRRDKLAVIRFPVKSRQAAPYFLQLAPAGWQLDFTAMSRTIGFNHRNQWHFRSRIHAYMFAFNDWRFDKNGFPLPAQSPD